MNTLSKPQAEGKILLAEFIGWENLGYCDMYEKNMYLKPRDHKLFKGWMGGYLCHPKKIRKPSRRCMDN